MTKKHTTSLGKPFDMDALIAKNEKVRAVGNMNVNARGDIIDSHNRVITDANKRVSAMYKKSTQNISKNTKVEKSKILKDETSQHELDDIDDDIPNPKKG